MAFGKKAKPHGRLFAIGDIHGCPDELAAILKSIALARGDTVVFVGDYVDRGPSACDVLEQLVELQRGPAETVFLKGNHEDMMLSFLGFPGHYGDSFLFNGGAQTLDSYGISETPSNGRSNLFRRPTSNFCAISPPATIGRPTCLSTPASCPRAN